MQVRIIEIKDGKKQSQEMFNQLSYLVNIPVHVGDHTAYTKHRHTSKTYCAQHTKKHNSEP